MEPITWTTYKRSTCKKCNETFNVVVGSDQIEFYKEHKIETMDPDLCPKCFVEEKGLV